mgnify:CR=1 FL=1
MPASRSFTYHRRVLRGVRPSRFTESVGRAFLSRCALLVSILAILWASIVLACRRQSWSEPVRSVLGRQLLFTGVDGTYAALRFGAAVGILLHGDRGRPLDAWTPLELKLAPMSNIYRVRVGLRYDRQILRWLRLAARVDLWVVGPGPEPGRDPLVFSAWLGADFALGRYTRLTVGVIYYNADQHRVEGSQHVGLRAQQPPDLGGHQRGVPTPRRQLPQSGRPAVGCRDYRAICHDSPSQHHHARGRHGI